MSWTELDDFTPWTNAKTKAELLADARVRINETSEGFWLDTELNQWLDDGALDVSARLQCLETSASEASAEDIGEYNLPDNMIAPFRFLYCNGAKWRRLPSIGWKDYDASYLESLATANPPDNFLIYQRRLILAPTPSYTAVGAGVSYVMLAGDLTKKFTYATSITASCAAFVVSHVAAYLAAAIVLTSVGETLVFTAETAGTGFTSPAMKNDTLGLKGTVVHTTANSTGVKQVDTMTVKATNLKMFYYKYHAPVTLGTDKYLIPPQYSELQLDFVVYQAQRKAAEWQKANAVYADYLAKTERANSERANAIQDRYPAVLDVDGDYEIDNMGMMIL